MPLPTMPLVWYFGAVPQGTTASDMSWDILWAVTTTRVTVQAAAPIPIHLGIRLPTGLFAMSWPTTAQGGAQECCTSRTPTSITLVNQLGSRIGQTMPGH